jgi:hypothetical protein
MPLKLFSKTGADTLNALSIVFARRDEWTHYVRNTDKKIRHSGLLRMVLVIHVVIIAEPGNLSKLKIFSRKGL